MNRELKLIEELRIIGAEAEELLHIDTQKIHKLEKQQNFDIEKARELAHAIKNHIAIFAMCKTMTARIKK